jgi:hypothetical protein
MVASPTSNPTRIETSGSPYEATIVPRGSGWAAQPAGPWDEGDGRSTYRLRSIVEEHCRRADPAAASWVIQPTDEATDSWIVVCRPDRETPIQGWKLHVSAGVATAEAVLRRVLAVLMGDDAEFKVAASLVILDDLNEGRAMRRPPICGDR